jgi:hypothetical protein
MQADVDQAMGHPEWHTMPMVFSRFEAADGESGQNDHEHDHLQIIAILTIGSTSITPRLTAKVLRRQSVATRRRSQVESPRFIGLRQLTPDSLALPNNRSPWMRST